MAFCIGLKCHPAMTKIASVATRGAGRQPPSIRSLTSCISERPTWPTKSLVAGPTPEHISPAELHHLLRLSALPLPSSTKEEAHLVDNLQRQLCFVQAIQACDMTGVEPLTRIHDETAEATRESTISIEELSEELDAEMHVGRYRRPRRVRDAPVETKNAEDWDPLSTASKTAGRYFVVKGKVQDEQ